MNDQLVVYYYSCSCTIREEAKWSKNVIDFIGRWNGLTFVVPKNFKQQELVRMFLNNFRHDLSIALNENPPQEE